MATDEEDNDLVTSTSRPSKATPVEAGAPEEQEAVTGRPNDTPIRDPEPPALGGSTFAERRKQREASEKRIASSENKAVSRTRARRK